MRKIDKVREMKRKISKVRERKRKSCASRVSVLWGACYKIERF